MPAAPLNVLIYSGHGTSEFSVAQTFKTLKRFLKSSYDLKLTGLDVLKNDRIPWDENCALFVMPGGRDLAYLESFKNTKIIERLANGVKSGKMKYLGICAGAYFAADRIEFEMGRAGYEISGERPLKLINTPAFGTLKTANPFTYDNTQVEAVEITTKKEVKRLKLAYNGGCYFPGAKEELIYARYSNEDQPAILLSNDFCLTGVHFEYDTVNNVELIEYEKDRVLLVCDILRKLGLHVKDSENEPCEQCEDDDVVIEVDCEVNELTRIIKNKSVKFIKSPSYLLQKFFLLHSKITTSTQTILCDEPELLDRLPNFSVYAADHQVKGKGRVNNRWISSEACLQFTLKIDWPMLRGNRLPLLQFLMALSLTETINSFKFQNSGLKAKIKWPNDVYLIDKDAGLIGKLSGILVNCIQSHATNVYHVLIGVGVNLESDPALPNITHLNDYLTSGVTKSGFLEELLERFKLRYDELLVTDSFPYEEYHQNWLHSSQQVELESQDSPRFVTIKGIDEFGYLIGKDVNTGEIYKIEPDGNSFDMMHNLIKRKI